MKIATLLVIFSVIGLFAGITTPVPHLPPSAPRAADPTYDHRGLQLALPAEVTFNAHIRGIMSNTCFSCHGPDEEFNESGVRFDSFQQAVDEAGAIEPGDASGSAFYQRIVDQDDPMPPANFLHQLSDYEKALFKKWIDSGANYEQHWAYSPLRRPEVPKSIKFGDRISNPVDAFILSRLEREGLTPAAEANRPTLLRRLSLDLIGLPPTPEEVQAFLSDSSDTAYEKQVDRLLASPHFGERMAAFWLDIVRFSDTVGFHGDQNQRNFSYRDFVIDSLNSNQPFDEFTRDQLAGDLLPEPTVQQLTATGLVRLNMVTREGGAQPGEYLAKYTADRVRMLGTAWLGSTTGCCECHNHKYDPFSIEDFYSLGAYFDDVRQWGVYSDYKYTPNPDLKGFKNTYPFPPELRRHSDSLVRQLNFLEREHDRQAARLVDRKVLQSEAFGRWLSSVRGLESSTGSSDGWQSLKPAKVVTSAKPKPRELPDGSVLFTGSTKGKQTTTLNFAFDKETDVRGLRFEVLPHEKNGGRIGRGKQGRFQASLKVKQVDPNQPQEKQLVRPRFVRIELDGSQYLSLAEVEVFSKVGGKRRNIARGGTAKQSSTYGDGKASLAIDGQTKAGLKTGPKTTHTKKQNNAWWEVDLGKESSIDQVVVWNRADKKYASRLKGCRLVLLDKDRQKLFVTAPKLPQPSVKIDIPDEAVVDKSVRLKVAYAVANRSSPASYVNGHPPLYLKSGWRSGPAKWQQPAEETKLDHVAVYALDKTLHLKPGEYLSVNVASSDVGRIRFSVSPLVRPVAGAAVSDALARALAGDDDVSLSRHTPLPNASSFVSLTTADNSSDNHVWLGGLTEDQRDAIKAAYYQYITPFSRQPKTISNLRDQIASCRSGLAMTTISQPVSPKELRRSRVLPRGNWQDETGQEVRPNTPHFLPGHDDHEGSSDHRQTRLDLAAWITATENPLTARHYANRVWAQFFGTGISNVIDDLGNQGEWPSHPQLLDWLASEFQSNWDRKHLIRLIVTSNTYRQQAAQRQSIQSVDPYNRLLAQQAARRLEAEVVRDNALAVSGLLNTQWVGGPSVQPYQPPGYYSNIQFPDRKYVVHTDGRQYRRGVYMHWQRTFLHPMLTNFDAPSRDECVAQRNQSNSPQQALTLLNDPVFVEASRALAARVLHASQPDDDRPVEGVQWIRTGFEIVLARQPRPAELAGLRQLFVQQTKYYADHPQEARAFLEVGQFRAAADCPDAQFAALGQVCRVILNLHETITRY